MERLAELDDELELELEVERLALDDPDDPDRLPEAVALDEEGWVVVVVPVPPSVRVVAAEAAVDAVDWMAMPRPRVLATPTLRAATSARLREAGWRRFVLMTTNVRSGRESLVRAG